MKTNVLFDWTTEKAQLCICYPSQFILQHQQELLPEWQTPIAGVVLLLQKSRVSFQEFDRNIVREKDRLRANFLRWGTNLIFALQDLGYSSDLFDPRTGYPLLGQQGKLSFDDNAVVRALLDYPVTSYKHCSLIEHPVWGDRVYPSTIVTTAPRDIIEPLCQKAIGRL